MNKKNQIIYQGFGANPTLKKRVDGGAAGGNFDTWKITRE